jgi:alpha-galactosidase
MAWQFDRPEAGQGVVQVFRRHASPYESARFKLRGLDPAGNYTMVNLDEPGAQREWAGRELLEQGLPIAISDQPGAAVFTYQKRGESR